jgi:N-acetylglucosamine-6-phosphate deacetylase
MASLNPAKLLGLNYLGELKPGNRADIILFTPGEKDMKIQKTYVAGKLVYEGER